MSWTNLKLPRNHRNYITSWWFFVLKSKQLPYQLTELSTRSIKLTASPMGLFRFDDVTTQRVLFLGSASYCELMPIYSFRLVVNMFYRSPYSPALYLMFCLGKLCSCLSASHLTWWVDVSLVMFDCLVGKLESSYGLIAAGGLTNEFLQFKLDLIRLLMS